MSKLFEKIVINKLKPVLHPFIDNKQHGFDKGKSTVTNLVEFSSYLRNNIGNGKEVDVVYTDFSKAFDVVNISILIHKLFKIGVRGNMLHWIHSYLTDRTQSVKFNNSFSKKYDVSSGVPQGSVLGPFLFLIFINDLPKFLKDVEYLMFADDLKIFRTIKNSIDIEKLQYNIDNLLKWCKINDMNLNVNKCSVITFSRKLWPRQHNYKMNDTEVKRTEIVKDLGVLFDKKLTFKPHIDRIVNSSYSTLGFIKRIAKEFDDPYITKSLYTSLIQSKLEYASIVWAPYRKVDIDRIESVQKQFLIFALKPLGFQGFILPPYLSRLLLLNMTSLENRRIIASNLFIYDLLNDRIKVNNLKEKIIRKTNVHNTRNKKILVEKYFKTDFTYNDVISKGIRNFNNNSDLFIENMSRNNFKNKLNNKFKILAKL